MLPLILSLPVLLVIVLFALSNQQSVRIVLWPTDFALQAPLSLAVLGLALVFFLGGADDFFIHVACSSTAQLRDFVAQQLSMDASVAMTQTNIVFDHLEGIEHMRPGTGWAQARRRQPRRP